MPVWMAREAETKGRGLARTFLTICSWSRGPRPQPRPEKQAPVRTGKETSHTMSGVTGHGDQLNV